MLVFELNFFLFAILSNLCIDLKWKMWKNKEKKNIPNSSLINIPPSWISKRESLMPINNNKTFFTNRTDCNENKNSEQSLILKRWISNPNLNLHQIEKETKPISVEVAELKNKIKGTFNQQFTLNRKKINELLKENMELRHSLNYLIQLKL